MNIIADKENKSKSLQAVGILSMGTFLEYFDLMLFVHMAVFLNDLFFPKTDPSTAKFITAFTFCITYVFRPIGALIFGWLGDNIGRKHTIILTTMLMAISCFTMAVVPTYDQIGITAAWIVTACRIMQSLSSMGELTGAELYLTESVERPMQYVAVSLMIFFTLLGSTAALGIAALTTSSLGLNWRYAFWFGLVIAAIGMIARASLKETIDFANAKKRLSNITKETGINYINSPILNEKINKKTTFYLFCMYSYAAICFYFTYFHIAGIFKETFHYTSAEVIVNNLKVTAIQTLACLLLSILSYFVYPLKIVRIRAYVFSALSVLLPILLYKIQTPMQLFIIQVLSIVFICAGHPANSILFIYFPIFKRFTTTCLLYATSRALTYVISSFGLIYLTKYLGHYGLWVLMLPMNILFLLAIIHFENLEKAAGRYPEKIELTPAY